MKLTFPMPPNLANSRMHWRVKHKAKVDFWRLLDSALMFNMGGDIPDPPTVPLQRAMISSVMFLGGAMDDDNALARHKWILDWLTSRGYIADDRKKCLTWESLPEQRIDRKNPRIEITIAPMEAE